MALLEIVLWVLIPCLLCGGLFALLATWLMTKKGNTMKDILQSKGFKDSEALHVTILNKLKIASNIPIVALYLVAATVAIPLPAFIAWLVLQEVPTFTLTGTIEELEKDKQIYIVPHTMRIESSGAFFIPLTYRSESQSVNFESDHYYPITLFVQMDKKTNYVTVTVTNRGIANEMKLSLDNMIANLEEPIRVKSMIKTAVVNKPSPEPSISTLYQDIRPPLKVNVP